MTFQLLFLLPFKTGVLSYLPFSLSERSCVKLKAVSSSFKHLPFEMCSLFRATSHKRSYTERWETVLCCASKCVHLMYIKLYIRLWFCVDGNTWTVELKAWCVCKALKLNRQIYIWNRYSSCTWKSFWCLTIQILTDLLLFQSRWDKRLQMFRKFSHDEVFPI